MVKESASESLIIADLTDSCADALPQTGEIFHGGVGQDGVIQMIPEWFNGIEFGRIGGEPFGPQPLPMGQNSLLHAATAMRGQSIPE